ncbi:hypothetical protein FOL47_000871 [Perkinsus chesapeaki]|uniref:Sorl1p n=1 Tax=Perkinsus chesapeaki TaxID=330153 RepID=A0A7J6KTW5_PERCH|nr:hypothetical protein FOL47_000871 [Perkinsus chesapeaki]
MGLATCFLLVVLQNALYASAQADWCQTHQAAVIYSKETMGEGFLPEGGVRMVDFAFDDYGDWYVAGEEKATGDYKVWRVHYSGKTTDVVFTNRTESIDVYHQGEGAIFVFAIVDNEIRMYGTPGNTVPPLEGEYKVIRRADDRYEFTGLGFDRSSHFLFASDKKNNQVYRYNPSTPGFEQRRAAGHRDGKAIDDDTHLYQPLAVKYARGDLYILQGPVENARLVDSDLTLQMLLKTIFTIEALMTQSISTVRIGHVTILF